VGVASSPVDEAQRVMAQLEQLDLTQSA